MNNSATIRYVVYNLLNSLRQIYDDAALSPFKVFFWVMTLADQLRYQHIVKSGTGAFVYKFDVAVEVDSTTGRNFFTLPAGIYDMEEDGGIQYITYSPATDLSLPMFASVTFTRTSPEKAARLYFREDETPRPQNPYFYRQNEKVWLLGVEEINLTALEVGLRTTLAPADLAIDIDLPLDLPAHLLPILERRVLDLGRFVMQIPSDKINDGAEWESKNFPTQKLISVNENQGQQYPNQQYNQE
jgi:hypothetical protein